MPSTSKRRRKFSVKNDNTKRKLPKNQKDQTSLVESNTNALMPINNFGKINANNSKNIANISSALIRDSATSISAETSPERKDKEISVSTTMIKLDTLLDINDSFVEQFKSFYIRDESKEKHNEIQLNRERTPVRRDKYPREHRIKVRSPKRRMLIVEKEKPIDFINSNKRTVGTLAITWKEEFALIDPNENTNDEERLSTHSLDDMCRICHGGESLSFELGHLISACACRGTVGRVHVKCLERWLTESGKSRCELCGTRYSTRRVHRYGVARAFVMWILSQNAKQLMVDSLGIMLMSPLAVLAAWLSGRTLAGLMTQESHVTPWPLASTFVLACMTLVCYYCWIVSAATRHALAWWIWYRSQYEVRLEIQDSEE